MFQIGRKYRVTVFRVFFYKVKLNFLEGRGWYFGEGASWVNFCWEYAAGLSEPLPHYSLFCGHIIDPILAILGKKQFSQSQLSHFLFMDLPYKAFKQGHPEMN